MATNVWRGDAQIILQVDLLTPGGALAAGHVLSVTINRKTYDYTVTAADVASADLVNAVCINMAAGLVDLSLTALEFAELDWTAYVAAGATLATAIQAEGPAGGVPFTVTVATTGGTFVRSASVVPTGPNWFSEADNWSLGTAPADDEDLVFESNAVDCLYGISQATVTPASIVIKASYTGKIGLPKENALGYTEYRGTALTLGTHGDGAADTIAIQIGQGDGAGSSFIRLNTGSKQIVLDVYSTGITSDGSTPPLTWIGTHASNVVRVTKGHVGIAFYATEAATVLTMLQTYIDSPSSDATVVVGAGATLGNVTVLAGTTTIHCACSSLTIYGGDVSLEGAGAVQQINLTNATLYASTSGMLGRRGTITGITAANPAVVTSVAHGLTTGDKVRIAAVVGMVQVNDLEFSIAVLTPDTFQLVGVNSSGYTAYSSAGVWGKIESVVVTGESTIDLSRSLAARQIAAPIDVYGDSVVIVDRAKVVSTLTLAADQFGIRYHHAAITSDLGNDYLIIRDNSQ